MFDPIRIYDKPAVILTQLGNGIATTDSVRRALFDPAALSPRERASYADELKKSAGGNPVVDTAIDVLANPLKCVVFRDLQQWHANSQKREATPLRYW